MEGASIVVRCSGKKDDGSPCEFTSLEEFQFCPVCGSSSVSNPSSLTITVIKCPGKNKLCGTPIASDSTHNFCKKCGWKIDKSLFLQSVKTCPGLNDDGSPCNAVIEEATNFCTNCGYDLTEEINENQSDNSIEDQITNTGAVKGEGQNEEKPTASGTDEGPIKEKPTASCTNGGPIKDKPTASGNDGGPTKAKPTASGTDGGPIKAEPTASGTDGGPIKDKPTAPGTDESPNEDKPTASGTDEGLIKDKPTTSGTDECPNEDKPTASGTDESPNEDKPTASGTDEGLNEDKPTASGTDKSPNEDKPTASGTDEGPNEDKPTASGTDESPNEDKPTASGTDEGLIKDKPTASGTDESPNADKPTASGTDEGLIKDKPTASGTDESPNEDKPTASGTDGGPIKDKPTAPGTDESPNEDKPTASGTDEGLIKDKPTTSGTDEGPIKDKPTASGTDEGPNEDKPTASGTDEGPIKDKPTASGTDEGPNEDKPTASGTDESPNEDKPTASGSDEGPNEDKPTASGADEGLNEDKPTASGTDESPNEDKPTASGADEGPIKDKPTASGTDEGPNEDKPTASGADEGPIKDKPTVSDADGGLNEDKPTATGTNEDPNEDKPTATCKNEGLHEDNPPASRSDKGPNDDKPTTSGTNEGTNHEGENKTKVAQAQGEETEDSDESSDENSDHDQGEKKQNIQDDKGSSVDPDKITVINCNEDPKTANRQLRNASETHEGKPARKKKKKKRNKKKTEEKSQTPPMETNYCHRNDDDTVEVVFHVLISETFKLNPNTDKVFISFQPDHLGGWYGCEKWKMNLESSESGLLRYSCQVPMSKSLRNSGFYYRYVVLKKDKESVRETVYVGQRSHRDEDRFFCLDSFYQNRTTPLDQYDGFVYPKLDENFIQRLLKVVYLHNAINVKISLDAKVATEVFLPTTAEVKSTLRQDLNDELQMAENLVEKATNVIKQMSKKIKSRDNSFEKQILKDYVVRLLHHVKNLKQDKHVKRYEGVLHLFYILTLFKRNNVKFQALELEKIHFQNMLLQPDFENKKCYSFEALNKHFPSIQGDLVKMVIDLIREHSAVKDGTVDSSWLYLIPLLHFLRGDSVPFVNEFSTDHSKSCWWGHAELYTEKDNLKRHKKWKIPIDELINDLEFLFDVDHLLPRTIMACVSFEKLQQVTSLQKLPAAVCCGTVHFYLSHYDLNHDGKKYFAQCIENIAQKFRQERKERQSQQHGIRCSIEECFATRQFGMKLASDVLKYYIMLDRNSVLIEATDLFASSVYECSPHEEELINSEKRSLLTKMKTEFRSNIEDCWKSVNAYLQAKFMTDRLCVPALKCWNEIYKADFGIEQLCDEWKKGVTEAVQTVLLHMHPDACLQLFDTGDVAVDLNQELQAAMTEAASRSYSALVMAGKNVVLQKKSNFGYFMSSLLEMYWPVDEMPMLTVHVLTWKPLVQYFKNLDETLKTFLSETATYYLRDAKKIIEEVEKMLRNGDIPLKLLKLILKDTSHIKDLLKHSLRYSKAESRVMEMVFEAREKELGAFRKDLRHANILLKSAAHINTVNSSELVNNIHHLERNLEEEIHINICKPLQAGKISKEALKNYNPIILIGGLSKETLSMAPQLELHSKSMIFMEMWIKESRKVPHGTDIEKALNEVFLETMDSWKSLCKEVSDGTITFDDIQEHLRVCGNEMKMKETELRIMCGDSRKDWVPQRLYQLQKYELLQGCRKAAQIIMEVKRLYDLHGDFGSIEAIEKLASTRDQEMNQLDTSVAATCKVLESWNDDAKQKCIKAFKDSELLVNWVKDQMADMKEVKVFVDLAFISAGEEEVDIQIVSCFHGAVTAYAPLIFETPKNCDSHVFLDNCNKVLKTLESDSNLPLKLTTASEKLHWLKDVKESHGSVEVTSLTQADNINRRGTYKVGNLQDTNLIGDADLSLDQVITLNVLRDPEKRREDSTEDTASKEYTHSKLVDLQSKLMLVAGKAERGKENVERFVMVLDGVDRLAKTYIRLCSDGCILFNCWTGEFFCDKNRKVCAVFNFGNVENMDTLKGHRGREDVDDFVVALANKFEKFHEAWLKYVSEKRDEYLELNHFTIEQLVFLQKELIKLGSEDEPSLLVYPMLSLIIPNCSQADLTSAMQEAKDAVFAREDDMIQNKEEEVQLADSDLVDNFMTTMLDSNFSIRLAKRAIVEVGAENIDEGVVWCLEHQEDEDLDDDEDDEVAEADEKTFEGWQVEEGSVSSSVAAWIQGLSDEHRKNTTIEKLLTSLNSIWENFLAAVSSSVGDYLSLEHLGIILRELAKADTEVIERKIPQPFQRGTPNLIVCPQVDLMNAVIYLYKHSEDQPLPRPDEVLLCTPQTSLDQVDIFLRRAFFSNPGKAYTLANADLLPYEIEEKVEKKLKEYANKVGDGADYQLVVLCSTENEFKARIIAALERNRCPPPLLHNLQDIRHYLSTKFSQACSQKDEDIEESEENKVLDEEETDESEDEESTDPASKVDFGSSNVRVIKSKRAGVGKSLYKKRLEESLHQRDWRLQQQNLSVQPAVTIHLYNKTVSTTAVADKLLHHTLKQDVTLPRIFHLDISYEVQEGVDYLLFNLLILGCISNSKGQVWLKSPLDLYLIETIPIQDSRHDRRAGQRLIHPLLEVLPDVHCWSPQDSLQILTTGVYPEGFSKNDRLFDDQEFHSEVYQRPFQYLKRWSSKSKLDDIDPSEPEGTHQECLQVLLQHCGVRDPAWSELHNFVWFLNTQLEDFERSAFCSDAVLEDLPGFPALVLQFLIQMSRDFATRSLVMSEQSPLDELRTEGMEEEDLAQFQMKRTWESSPHPYIFFNPDGHSMTFLGFNIERHSGNMVDQQTGQILEKGLVPRRLQDGLIRNSVNINENFDQMERLKRLEKLCNVMPGVDFVHDPDDTYELTTDNVKKILAIYMRFRCGIPVIIMGETGCGKTRLVKFMCDLQCLPGSDVENMVIMKVHGGTTSDDIIRKVKQAEDLAAENKAKNKHMYTVLFFDEANTTEAIGLIKEIMCDGAIDGQPLRLDQNLKIVAACNPYRKHSDELIERLEKAGLGYHVDAEKTTDKLGRVPMRRLVYRVQPLPQSMLPLVWDFGQLNTQVEELYVKQMVNRYMRNGDLPKMFGPNAEVVSQILIAAQMFMRELEDECSFVSLRDVDRTLTVMAWFLKQSQENRSMFDMIDEKLSAEVEESDEDSDHETSEEGSDEDESLSLYSFDESPRRTMVHKLPDDVTKSLILALSVCYRASLRSRDEFDEHIVDYFQRPCYFSGGKDMMVQVIDCCQSMFVDEVHLEDNIAKNMALKENLFMMVVCIELRIPLFLVGKPGSSKSLAKTIVADAMQGNSARSELFKQLKETRMVAFQCSPLATAEGIVGTFRQCARYQQDKDLSKFVSIVVLDEVGLAEDSPRMPLKTLHPLLEDGCQGDEKSEPHKKVSFIGISNWALDPAKMNRGILVQREVPNEEELLKSAEGICSSEKKELSHVFLKIKPLLPHLANAFVEVFKEAQETRREFFGLRDFYSLVKMVHALVATTGQDLCWHQLEYAVRRNFGGLDNVNAVDVFKKLSPTLLKDEEIHEWDPNSSTIHLIKAGIFGDDTKSESRYLLLLTENYGALSILEQQILEQGPKTIFGSSFPKDQEYTQVCRNINKIKVYMETGKTVVLLNLDNLYESLYDALNQYYAKLGGQRFVDLGLGTHRVKCRVHEKFRLIVVAEKQVVYDKFPIPLINRLEKHLLSLDSMMTPEQVKMAQKLDQWASDFVTPQFPNIPGQRNAVKEKKEDAFIGYHADTSAAIVLHVWGKNEAVDSGLPTTPLFDKCKEILLWCASPQYVVRLKDQKLYSEAQSVSEIYWKHQKHEDLFQYLLWKLREEEDISLQAQITTHSKLLTDQEKEELAQHLNLMPDNIILLTLQSFDTEQQFSQQIKNFIQRCEEGQKLVLIQCGSGDRNQSLIKSAQYCVFNVLDDFANTDNNFAVVFIVQLPNTSGGCFSGFQAGKWHSVHLDELTPQGKDKPRMEQLYHKTPASLLNEVFTNRLTTSPVECDRHRDGSGNLTEGRSFMGIEDGPMIYQREEKNCDDEILHVPPFLYQLLLTTVQSAAALIQDSEWNQRRSTERIELVMDLLGRANAKEADAMLFVKHLLRLVIALQKGQEEASGGEFVLQNWLNKKAAQTENVQEAGTFRRAWTQYLEKRITPALAQVMAFIDTSRNLDLVCKVDDGAWTRNLWLNLLQKTTMCLEHCMSVSMIRRQIGHSVIAPYHFGETSTGFSVQTPFFWLLYRDINTIVVEYAKTGEHDERDDSEPLPALEGIVSSMPYGQSLTACIGEDEKSAFIKAYLTDFVCTIHGSGENLQILCDAVESAARQCERDLNSLSSIQAVVYIHLIHADVKERLNLFLEVKQIWPDVVQAVTHMKENVAGNPLLTREEMTLDVLSGMLLLEQLEPTKEQLNNERGRTEWMDRVKTYLPIIEKIINSTETDMPHGPVCCGSLEDLKCEWSRVVAVKLFLESFTNKDKFKMEERCMPLWVMLGKKADFTKLESLEKTEKFLKIVHSKVEGKLIGKKKRCAHCETEFGEKLVTELSCSHRLCSVCFDEAKASADWKCPVCKESISKKFKPKTDTPEQRKVKEEYQEYLKCCNNFLMLVVSKLCFGGTVTPDSAVIEKIFSYITRRVYKGHQTGRVYTKEMSVFNDMIDPTPVVRSFLLQLLIHESKELVSNHLQEFFLQAQSFCQEEKIETSPETVDHIVEFSLLVVHCYEDLYHEQASGASSPVKEMDIGSQFLRNGRQGIARLGIDMNKILAIAQCRFGLIIASKYLHLVLVNKTLIRSREFHQLLHEVRNLFDVKDIEWPKKFLVKQICKEYGTDSYQTITSTQAAKWLAMETDTQTSAGTFRGTKRGAKFVPELKECPDRYIVCGEHYQRMREAMTKVCLGEDKDYLENLIEDSELEFLLAAHRELTMKNINTSTDAEEQLKHELTQEFTAFVSDSTFGPKEEALKLLRNEFGQPGSFLNIYPEESLRDQSLVCVLVHIQLVFTHFNHMPQLLKPLNDLINQPQTMADKYFPTMPQDDTEELRQIMLRAMKEDPNTRDIDTVLFFCCPNGHPYAIGECGRPYEDSKCNICGEKIGGKSYNQAFAGNTPHAGVDQTRPGYILGGAADRTNHFVGERRLEGPTCAVLRFFTHAALFLGTETDPQAVSGLVTPAVEEDIGEFFWQHLQKDLEIIHLASGKSVDDVFLLLHFICHQISQSEELQETDDHILVNKQSREEWEDTFASNFITPTLKNLEGCLKTCNELMMNDHRMGQDKLMSVLYEVDKSRPTEVECLHEFPAVWRYRSRITLDHFLREFNLQVESDKNKKSKMAVLSLFRKEHPLLQALFFIPNILRLQQTLMAKYRRTLNRTQAIEMTIAEMLTMLDPKSRKDIQNLIFDFVAAWDCAKERVSSEGCWTVHDGLIHLPDAYKNMKVDENSPLAVLLPSTQGPGICSYMTIEFLLRRHNEFMEGYCNIIKTSFNRLPEVSVRKLHSSHLVSYHPDRDLLPLVLANCNYSFELGKGTKIDYDFSGFEYQLRETILQAKSRVEQKGHVIPIDTMMYAADSGNVVMFSILRDKIPQQSLPPAVKIQIMRELKAELSDICDSINNLDIAISFLKHLGGDPDQSLQKFMFDALKMKQTITSQKARQFCEFKHVQSLWLLLNFEKSVVLTEKFRQDSFAHLDSQFREELSEELSTELEEFVQRTSLEKLELLLQQMFDCLLLRVAHTDKEGVDLTTVRLSEILIGHLDAPLFHLDKEQEEHVQLMKDMESFPAEILGKHIPHVWTLILQEFNQRKAEM